MKWYGYWFVVILCLALARLAPAEDSILLKNGDRISGTILETSDSAVTLQSPQLGTLTVLRESIQKIDPVGAKALSDPEQKEWSGSFDFGYTLTESATDSQQLYALFELKRQLVQSKLSFRAQAFWGEADDETNTQKADGRGKFEYTFSPRIYVFDQFTVAYDRLRGLDLEVAESVGAGYRLIRKINHVLAFEAGPSYLFRSERLGADELLPSCRVAQSYWYQINDQVELTQEFEYTQRLDDLDFWKFHGFVSLRVGLTKRLALKLTVLEDYDPQLQQNNYLQFITSIGIYF